MKMKKILSIFLSVFVLFSMVLQGSGLTFAQENKSEKTKVKITDFSIEHADGSTDGNYIWWEKVNLKMTWDASMYQNQLHEGDYFDVTLPDKMSFPENKEATNFDILSSDGTVIAKAVVTPNRDGGGKVSVTFTKYVENKFNIKGTMKLSANFIYAKIKKDSENNFDITVNGETKTLTVPTIKGRPKIQDEVLGKWSEKTSSESKVLWNLRINHGKTHNQNVVIRDRLHTDDGNLHGMMYIPGTFRLSEVEYDEYGELKNVISTKDVSDAVVFNEDKTAFEYKLGNLNTKQYRLTYHSTYVTGVKLKNSANIKSDTSRFYAESSFQSSSASGSGQGDLLSKIKIIKVDSEHTETKLSGAKFKITKRSDGSNFELTTNANGEAVSEKLIPGDYEIVEISAPARYTIDRSNYKVSVTSGGATIITIKNEPVKTAVSATKKWIGKAYDSAVIRLFADNVDTGKRAVLNATNNWRYTFDNLRKYKPDGTEITYSIKEEAITNYETNITGNQNEGYVITNTNVEKLEIPVKKTWIGKAATQVSVKLLADGKETGKSIELNETTQWKGYFSDLPKYDAKDGHEIYYTILEVDIAGYESRTAGSSKTGFEITNTITGKTSIPVTKKWVGKAFDAVKVRLFANGKEVAFTVLDDYNHWMYTFANYPKYDSKGNEIRYTVKEDVIANYETKITGNQNDGYVITNTNIEKLEIPVKKTWIGKPTNQVIVKLLADGKETGKSLVLNASTQWKGRFTDLAKYDTKDGHEINYTIEEDRIVGYEHEIAGSSKTGFEIINIITGKVSIPVKKIWIGKALDCVKVRLFANDEEVADVSLTKENKWTHTFTNYSKYDSQGKEIRYTVKEDTIANYETNITGNQNEGYVITNTNIEKLEIPVKKTWIGKPTTQVSVKLLADGKETGKSLVLNASTQWKGRFSDLPKYDAKDGHEINYTIEEEIVKGYTTQVTGDVEKGFIITNTEIPPQKPKTPPVVDTSDETDILLYIKMLFVVGVLFSIMGVKYKRNKSI